jgi:predicted PurR-regulated permease PerM
MELTTETTVTKRPLNLAGQLISAALIISLLYFGRLLFVTLVSAVILAFLLEPFVQFFQRFRVPRGLASFMACAAFVLVLYLAGLGAWTQIARFWGQVPTYSARVNSMVDSASLQVEEVEKSMRDLWIPKRIRDQQAAQQIPQRPPEMLSARKRRPTDPVPQFVPPLVQEVRIQPEGTPILNTLLSYVGTFGGALLMASFVPFLVYFMLSWRDHVRRSWLNLFEGEKRDFALKSWHGIATVARAYVVGNFLLGLLVSIASTIFFWFVNIPYWQLVGPMSGFLSLIPYIGLPLALIPPFFAALPVYSGLSAYLIIGTTVAMLHLLALNLLYPKVVGARVHLNPIVVTLALMAWYMLWGGAGLVLAIPITAGVKSVCDSVPSLRDYGRLLGD